MTFKKTIYSISFILACFFIGILGFTESHLSITPPSVINVNPVSNTIALYSKYEMQFDLTTSFSNPFDPSVIDIQAIVTSPTNLISTTFAFWYQPFTISGGVNTAEIYTASDTTHWLIRFTPTQVGNYSYVIQVNSVPGNSVSSTLYFTAVTSSNNGFIRTHPNNYKYFQFDNSSFYFPIGQDLAGNSTGTHPTLDGVTAARYYHPRLAANKANWIRFWMTNIFNNAIEWTGTGYSGLGNYALDRAYRIDKILESAQANNIYIQFTLLDFRQVSDWADVYWPQSPYNSVNGGPVSYARPQDFFTNSTAMARYQNQLRYIVARWGYLPNIFAWEHFNEVEYSGDSNDNVFIDDTVKTNIINWHKAMAQYLKTIDPNKHLVTTSSDDPWYGKYGFYTYSLWSSLWLIPQMDIIQTHIYTSTIENDITQQSRYFQNTFHKPDLIAEFGLQNNPEYTNTTAANGSAHGFDPTTFNGSFAQRDHLLEGTHHHNALWTALMNETMSGIWWWDYYIESDTTLHRTSPQFPLYYHYVPINAYLQITLNPAKYPFEDWPNYGLSSAIFTTSANIKACGLSTVDRAYFWFRDTANDYYTGAEPGDIANRTISNATITLTGLLSNTLYAVRYFDTYNYGGPIGQKQSLQSSNTGTLTLSIPSFQRDLAVKILKLSEATSIPKRIWKKY